MDQWLTEGYARNCKTEHDLLWNPPYSRDLTTSAWWAYLKAQAGWQAFSDALALAGAWIAPPLPAYSSAGSRWTSNGQCSSHVWWHISLNALLLTLRLARTGSYLARMFRARRLLAGAEPLAEFWQ